MNSKYLNFYSTQKKWLRMFLQLVALSVALSCTGTPQEEHERGKESPIKLEIKDGYRAVLTNVGEKPLNGMDFALGAEPFSVVSRNAHWPTPQIILKHKEKGWSGARVPLAVLLKQGKDKLLPSESVELKVLLKDYGCYEHAGIAVYVAHITREYKNACAAVHYDEACRIDLSGTISEDKHSVPLNIAITKIPNRGDDEKVASFKVEVYSTFLKTDSKGMKAYGIGALVHQREFKGNANTTALTIDNLNLAGVLGDGLASSAPKSAPSASEQGPKKGDQLSVAVFAQNRYGKVIGYRRIITGMPSAPAN